MANSVTRQRIATASLLEYANKNRDEEFFSDITINAGTESIPANRLVLSCYSRYFEGMFKSRMRERYENIIEIQSVEGEIMKALVDFIYSGSVTINDENVMSLLSGADYLQLHEVKQFCFEFLRSNTTPQNAICILKAATLYKNEALTKEAQQYINTHFDEVAQTKEFLEFSKKNLATNISNTDAELVKATSIYNAILLWIRHDEETRREEFSELFKLVKLSDVPMDFLEEVILEEKLVTTNFECQKSAISAFRQMVQKQKTNLQPSKLLTTGGKKSGIEVDVALDLEHETAKLYPNLPAHTWGHSSLKLNDYVYCIGGKATQNETEKSTSDVWRFNSGKQNAVWEQFAAMNKARGVMGAAVYYDTLVVVGGDDENYLTQSSTEFYQAAEHKWKLISSMNEPRYGHAVVTCDGYLYAIGGYNNMNYVSTTERLSDLTATSWENVASMQTPRVKLAAVNCGGEIYAIGGRAGVEGDTTLKSVEKYDFASNQWKYVSDMNIERVVHAACVLRNKIYVVGGVDKNNKVVKDIDCYDPANDTWTIVGSITHDLFHHSMVAL